MPFFNSGIPGIDLFEGVLFMVEWMPFFFAVNLCLVALTFIGAVSPRIRIPAILALPTVWIIMIASTWGFSHLDARARGYDMSLPSMRQALEAYIETGDGNLEDPDTGILESNKYPPTFGMHEMRYLVKDLLAHTILHLDRHNTGNIAEGYNKGNDWFEATLGEPMVYTSGIYANGDETLVEAQNHKLDYVADAIELKKGENVLDIGCGWGRLLKHFTDKYGAKATGITLSTEQRKYALDLNGGASSANGDVAENGATILLQDAMKMYARPDLPEGGFDKITSLEMAEHVGIVRYNEFLTSVHDLLKDDGVFYFQVAGLRRAWRYEDFVWGLFMGEHVFPGADASCPLGWVSTQLERAGFEIQRVHNLGTHYSRTLAQWLEVWRSKEESVTAKYGAVSYRRWEVFLAWSVRVARQGSSTVFMFTLTKADTGASEARRIQTQRQIAPKPEHLQF